MKLSNNTKAILLIIGLLLFFIAVLNTAEYLINLSSTFINTL